MGDDGLLKALEGNIGILFSFVGSIKNEIVVDRDNMDNISIFDHIKHLSLLQKGICDNIAAFIDQEAPRLRRLSLKALEASETIDIKDVSSLMRSFEYWRKRQIGLIGSTGGKMWEKRSGDEGATSFETFVKDILLNDSFHMKRMSELRVLKKIDAKPSTR